MRPSVPAPHAGPTGADPRRRWLAGDALWRVRLRQPPALPTRPRTPPCSRLARPRRAHLQSLQRARARSSEESAPAVVVVVRPSCCCCAAVSRPAAQKSIELADLAISFPQPDPSLRPYLAPHVVRAQHGTPPTLGCQAHTARAAGLRASLPPRAARFALRVTSLPEPVVRGLKPPSLPTLPAVLPPPPLRSSPSTPSSRSRTRATQPRPARRASSAAAASSRRATARATATTTRPAAGPARAARRRAASARPPTGRGRRAAAARPTPSLSSSVRALRCYFARRR